jgi:hypothetical protein
MVFAETPNPEKSFLTIPKLKCVKDLSEGALCAGLSN